MFLGLSTGGGINQDPTQNLFSEDKIDKGIYVTTVSEGGPEVVAGLQTGDKIRLGYDDGDQVKKRLTKRNEVIQLLVTSQSLQKAVQQSFIF